MEDKNRTIFVERFGPQYDEWTPGSEPWSVVVSFASEDLEPFETPYFDSAMELAIASLSIGEGPILIDGDELLDGENWKVKA